jgi:hypothetical protein
MELARTTFVDLNFTIITGHHYLSGFIGNQDPFETWIREKTQHWSEAVTDLASFAKNFPQSAYSGLQKVLQQEWQFVQRVKKDIGMEFTNVERAISQSFLPDIFDNPPHSLTCLPVKHTSLAIQDPTESFESNYEASTLACSHLVAALKGVKEFQSLHHLARVELQSCSQVKHDSTLIYIILPLFCDNCSTILQGKDTGQWLLVLPSVVNGT